LGSSLVPFTKTFGVKSTGEFDDSNPLPKFQAGELSSVAWCSVERTDRDGDVVLIGDGNTFGINRKNFDLNSSCFWSHNDEIPAPGNWQWVVEDIHPCGAKGLLGKLVYNGNSELGLELYKADEGGFIRGRSISFLTHPSWMREPTEEELKSPFFENCSRVIERCELTEISICNVGCNPLALVERLSETTAKRLGFSKPAQTPTDKQITTVAKEELVMMQKKLEKKKIKVKAPTPLVIDHDLEIAKALNEIDLDEIVARAIDKVRNRYSAY
jgi:hypothetical protein